MNALTTLRNAERTLLDVLGQAAEQFESLGTTQLDQAIDRLERATETAKERIAQAMIRLTSLAEGLADFLQLSNNEVADDLAHPTPVQALNGKLSTCDSGESEAKSALDSPDVVGATPAQSCEVDSPLDTSEISERPITDARRERTIFDCVEDAPDVEDEPVEVLASAACSPIDAKYDAKYDEPPLFPASNDGPYSRDEPVKKRSKRKPR